ncbi:MAG: zinc dependent phospholipase C family protein [Proteobacteria bacterium]|nr:zinc dependent phospholipase C family protein [Pseudomonadota bacterium]
MSFIVFFLFPEFLYAFGPAFHLQIGREILNYLNLFSPLTQQIISSYPYDFLYGNISADIIVGKRFMPYHKHCHSFEVAKSLLDQSTNDRQKAFSYGYLCHLVSDVVAHNFFVPYMIISTFKSRTLTHLYWETRLDNKVDKSIWNIIDTFKRKDFTENETLLKRVLTYNFFPFEVHNKIYKGYILFLRLDRWHKTLDFVKNFSKYKILKFVINDTLKISVDYCNRVLMRNNDEFIYKNDPMGRKTLQTASMIKRNLKRVHMYKPIDFETEKNLANHFRKRLKIAMQNPDRFSEIISAE